MPSQSPNLEELLKFEEHLESGFVALLNDAGLPYPHSSRGIREINSPYVSIYAQLGGYVANHQYLIPDGSGRKIFDVYTATITAEVVTNRGDEAHLVPTMHTAMLGKLRLNMQFFRIVPRWEEQSYLVLADVRETGTVDTFQDEEELDHTIITYSIIFNVKPTAWPLNFDA